MTEYDDVTIYSGVDCFYSLWDVEQQRYVPAQPKRLYEVTLQQAYNDLMPLTFDELRTGGWIKHVQMKFSGPFAHH